MTHYSKISLLITLCIFFVLCMSGCSSSGSSSSGGAATFNEVTWTSSDEWVAVVDETGKVSASDKPGAYPGTAVITATNHCNSRWSIINF